VCVRENWFVGFTEGVRCTPSDEANGRTFRVSHDASGLTVTPLAPTP